MVLSQNLFILNTLYLIQWSGVGAKQNEASTHMELKVDVEGEAELDGMWWSGNGQEMQSQLTHSDVIQIWRERLPCSDALRQLSVSVKLEPYGSIKIYLTNWLHLTVCAALATLNLSFYSSFRLDLFPSWICLSLHLLLKTTVLLVSSCLAAWIWLNVTRVEACAQESGGAGLTVLWSVNHSRAHWGQTLACSLLHSCHYQGHFASLSWQPGK